MNKGVSTVAVCALAGYLAGAGNPGYAFLVILFGLAFVWDR